MFVKINGTYIPLNQCVILDKSPEEILLIYPGAGKWHLKGDALTTFKAVLALMEKTDKVIDLEEAFKRSQVTTPEPAVHLDPIPKIRLPKVLSAPTLQSIRTLPE